MHGVIFDLDGTLVHSLPGIAQGVNHALAAHGHPVHDETVIRSFIGDGLWRTCRRALPSHVSDEAVADILEAQTDYYSEHWRAGTELYNGIADLLETLTARGIPVAVCTNKPHHLAEVMMRTLFAEFAFAAVIGQRENVPAKPDPAGALEIADLFGIPPAQIHFVGDSTIDFHTAVKAHMSPQLVAWGYHDPPVLAATGAPVHESVLNLLQALQEPPQV